MHKCEARSRHVDEWQAGQHSLGTCKRITFHRTGRQIQMTFPCAGSRVRSAPLEMEEMGYSPSQLYQLCTQEVPEYLQHHLCKLPPDHFPNDSGKLFKVGQCRLTKIYAQDSLSGLMSTLDIIKWSHHMPSIRQGPTTVSETTRVHHSMTNSLGRAKMKMMSR